MLFLLGVLTMIASTLMLFLGTNVVIAVIARALQGLSGALVWVSGFALLTEYVEAKNVGWAMGITSVMLGAGELLGPVIGGVMYDHAGHFAVLGLVCAILGVDMIIRVMLVDKVPKQDTDNVSDEDGEARPLLRDRLEEPQRTQQAPKHWKEPTTRKPVQRATINLFGFRLPRDFSASCYAICINGLTLFAFESVSHFIPPLDSIIS